MRAIGTPFPLPLNEASVILIGIEFSLPGSCRAFSFLGLGDARLRQEVLHFQFRPSGKVAEAQRFRKLLGFNHAPDGGGVTSQHGCAVFY